MKKISQQKLILLVYIIVYHILDMNNTVKLLNCTCGYSTNSVFTMEKHFRKNWSYSNKVNKNGHKIIKGLITHGS